MAGFRLPIETHVLQAFVSESVKPVLDLVVTYGAGHFYVSQSDKGGLVFGGHLDGYNSYAQRGSLPVVEDVLAAGVDADAVAARLRVLRQWGGVMDMSMDGNPIISRTPVENLFLNGGWCYGGFKAIPAGGLCCAHTRRHRRAASLMPPSASRFARGGRSTSGASAPCLASVSGLDMLRIACPFCGPRDEVEFRYRGDAMRSPAAGRWRHRGSCLCL